MSSAESVPVVRRPILIRLACAFLGSVAGLIVVDVAVARWDRLEGARSSGAIVSSPALGWTNRPHFENPAFGTVLDRFGLRSPEIPDDAPPNELRIAGFGASRLYGAGGAQQSWCWNVHLERLLVEQGFGPLRVLNGGVMGYSAVQAARRAALCLDALEPDLLFVTLTPRAQILLDVSSQKNVVRFGPGPEELLPADVAAGWPELAWPLVARVHRGLMELSGIYRRHRAGFQVGGERKAGLQKWLLSAGPRDPELDELLAATFEELVRLRDRCAEREIEFLVVMMPEIQQDSDAVWARYLRDKQEVGAPPIGTLRDEPTRELIGFLEAYELPFVDFTAEVELVGTDRARYLVSDEDFHWSEPGHRLFAEGLARRLVESGRLQRLRDRRDREPRSRPFGPNPFEDLIEPQG